MRASRFRETAVPARQRHFAASFAHEKGECSRAASSYRGAKRPSQISLSEKCSSPSDSYPRGKFGMEGGGSVTRRLVHFSIFGHLQQWKFAQEHYKFAKVSSKFGLNTKKAFKIA